MDHTVTVYDIGLRFGVSWLGFIDGGRRLCLPALRDRVVVGGLGHGVIFVRWIDGVCIVNVEIYRIMYQRLGFDRIA